MLRRRRLCVEPLEDRATPVVWNSPWADPGHLTLSFAPNGTDVRGRASTLFSDLNPVAPADWQREALRAFQTWAAAGNINIAVVPDLAVPFGTPGAIQGDPRHGDIRLGATDLGAGQLAATTPFDLFGGWSGSVLLNSAQAFNLGGTDGAHDLFTVLLQEAGHVFGVGNSTDPGSAMYEVYQGPRAGLSAGDVADLQALYGRRAPDRFDARLANNTLGRATPLQFAGVLPLARGPVRPAAADGDLTTLADVDVYSVRVPAGVGSFTAHLRTTGVSLLTARLTVLDGRGRVVGSAVATDPLASDLTVVVANARPGAAYYLRVEGAQDDVFGIGGYRLAAGLNPVEATVPPDPGAGLTDGASPPLVSLGVQKEGRDRRWDYALRAGLGHPTETDTYTVRTRQATPETLVVAAWALRPGGLDPAVAVFDPAGRPVPAEVLTDDGGSFTLQVRDVRPNTTYSVRVAAADPALPTSRGGYFLGIDFRQQEIAPLTFAADTLTADQPAVAATMTVAQAQLLHFALAAVAAGDPGYAGVRLSIRNAVGREVFTLTADAGHTASGNVLLPAGEYQLVVAGGTRYPWQRMPDLGFTLTGLVRNDPIGIKPDDTTDEPTRPPPPPPSPETTETTPYTGPYTGPYRPS